MPNGWEVMATIGSRNAPGVDSRWKCESITSTRPPAKSVAYTAGWCRKNPIARPLNTAPGTASFCRKWVCGTVVFVQAETTPASESTMNRAGWRMPPPMPSLNPFVPLNTWPVGAPCGTETTSGTMLAGIPPTPPAYSVATFMPLSATQIGLLDENARPQGLTRCGSVTWAMPGMSETRLIGGRGETFLSLFRAWWVSNVVSTVERDDSPVMRALRPRHVRRRLRCLRKGHIWYGYRASESEVCERCGSRRTPAPRSH